MSDVVLIRPGCTDFDEQKRIQGSLDLPLSPRGQDQVERLVLRLRQVQFDVVFSAPCEPARSTAMAVSDECGVPHKELADLRNLDHGLWQGLQVDDVRRKYPKVFKQWQESPETVCLPQGETVADAVARIQRALRKCLKRKRTVGIVASEPLATLIGCVLRHSPPELPESSPADAESRVEFFHLSDEDWKWSVGNRAWSLNGSGNGEHPTEVAGPFEQDTGTPLGAPALPEGGRNGSPPARADDGGNGIVSDKSLMNGSKPSGNGSARSGSNGVDLPKPAPAAPWSDSE